MSTHGAEVHTGQVDEIPKGDVIQILYYFEEQSSGVRNLTVHNSEDKSEQLEFQIIA